MVFSMDVLHFFIFGLTLSFMYYRKHQSGRLPDALIQKFTGFHNPEYKKNKCTVYIGTILSLRNFVGMQKEKYRGAARNCLKKSVCVH